MYFKSSQNRGPADFKRSDVEIVEIESISEFKEEQTYDIEVEDEHYFITKSSRNKIDESIDEPIEKPDLNFSDDRFETKTNTEIIAINNLLSEI